MDSQYTWENVCIVPGGRAGLIRIAAILGNSYLSFPIPDYSAYSEMLSLFKNVYASRQAYLFFLRVLILIELSIVCCDSHAPV